MYIIRSKLKHVLENRGLTQKELAQMAGIREGAISDLARLHKTTINVGHLSKVMQTLEIKDFNELFEIIE